MKSRFEYVCTLNVYKGDERESKHVAPGTTRQKISGVMKDPQYLNPKKKNSNINRSSFNFDSWSALWMLQSFQRKCRNTQQHLKYCEELKHTEKGRRPSARDAKQTDENQQNNEEELEKRRHASITQGRWRKRRRKAKSISAVPGKCLAPNREQRSKDMPPAYRATATSLSILHIEPSLHSRCWHCGMRRTSLLGSRAPAERFQHVPIGRFDDHHIRIRATNSCQVVLQQLQKLTASLLVGGILLKSPKGKKHV